MSLFLRLSIASLFFLLSIIIYSNPIETRDYINDQYQYFLLYIESLFQTLIPFSYLIKEISKSGIDIISFFIFVGGIAVICNIRKYIITYAYIITIISIVLHIPYNLETMETQLKKLLYTFLLFFSMIILSTLKDKKKAYYNEKPKKVAKWNLVVLILSQT